MAVRSARDSRPGETEDGRGLSISSRLPVQRDFRRCIDTGTSPLASRLSCMSAVASLVLVLFGCSDDLAACERIQAEPMTYVSASDCEAQQARVLQSRAAMIADYPTVVANCVSAKHYAAMGTKPINLNKPIT